MSRPAARSREAPGLASRVAATALLSAVLDRHQPLDAALESETAFTSLPLRDRALARAIVGTALRRHGTIAAILASLIEREPRHAGNLMRVLETAAAQLLFMEVADHAAVSLAVDQLAADHEGTRYKALANAVLRRIARERERLLQQFAALSLDTPDWLWRRWVATHGEATAEGIAAAHRLEPTLDLSVKSDPAEWAEKLGGIALPTGSVRLLATGDVAALPGYAEGAWWVQDAAAALPARLLGDVRGKKVADLCAAPGGKTAALAAAGADVTAVDISAPRLERLSANLARLGLSATTVAADVLKWNPQQAGKPEIFDAIVLDAPCTATGTIRRHPDVAWLKRAEDVAALASLQAKLIDKATALLKPGGTLVYCTCSLEPEEGEAHVASALARLPLALAPIDAAEIGGLAETITPLGTVRTLPSHLANPVPRLSGMDGFFVMRLGKRRGAP